MLLSIEKLIYGGDGLARAAPGSDGRSTTVMMPFVLPGEEVEAEVRLEKPGLGRGTITRVMKASSNRVEAHCPYFQGCGGCQYQHISYEKQLEFKTEILRETLWRIAKIELKTEIRTHGSPAWGYRNRVRMRVRTTPEFELGYFRYGSHEFLGVKECPIASPSINRAVAWLLEVRGLDCPASVEEVELFVDGEDRQLLVWVFCGREAQTAELVRWLEAVRKELPEISGMVSFSIRVSRHKSGDDDESYFDSRLLAQSGAAALQYRVGSHDYRVSAGSFFQVNRHLVEEMVGVVTRGASGELALDLYAGVGLFSVALAAKFHHIFAVEASQTSFGDLLHNGPANVKAVGALAEDYLSGNTFRGRSARKHPDLVVMDPPRAGAGKGVIRALVELGAPRVRYVSCDPATLARDLAPLLAAGYRIAEAHLFDLFPETFHIESVVLLER